MAEDTLHSDDNVSVTTTRVVAGGTTYALRNITSVKMAETPAQYGCAITALIVTLFLIIAALAAFGDNAGAGIFGGLIAVGALFATISAFKKAKPDYHVVIHSASGEANALTSQDKDYITSIVAAINNAIVEYQ